jgi:hypothetical protein
MIPIPGIQSQAIKAIKREGNAATNDIFETLHT